MSEIEICFKVCVSITSLWFVYAQDLRSTQLVPKESRELLVSTEIPAEHIDPASIDLTNLVNTLINASLPGSKNLFSLLSVTSHSSLSLHKLTLLVYNISNIRDIESTLFSTRYCYCLTNRTNDLTDFTAILLDVMGNSTSYLQELFKSSSILSVSQKNSSECIYICVMAGKTDSDLSQLWNMGSVTPLFNQTIMEEKHRGNVTVSLPLLSTTTMATSTATASPVTLTTTPTMTTASFQTSAVIQLSTSAVIQTKPYNMPQQRTTSSTEATRTVATTTSYNITSIGTTTRTLALHPGKGTTTASSKKLTKTGCPWRKEFVHKGSGKKEQDDSEEEQQIWGGASISLTKLQPCVLELCKFYSQCVCRGFRHSAAAIQRYCVDSHRWYERHTAEICSRVKRVALSKNLKQKCVARMCVKT